MASSSSPSQQNEQNPAFLEIEPPFRRRGVSESSRVFDVFINHRGPDVKQTLARQLYNSLQQLGIQVFLDSEEKELGDWFPSTIETAICSASVHIAIFSKRYAESAWCLAELVLMLQSKAKIIPVFYEVKPFDLRYIEKGVYADAFIDYEKKSRYLKKLKEWKEALQTASFITGEEFSGDCRNIVSAVQKAIQRCKLPLEVAKYPVGLDKLAKDFERRCLDVLVQDFERQCGMNKEGAKGKVQIVGIFGMGGAGKTTLSKELFNQKRSQYARESFLVDVREASARRELPSLQRKLIKDLFKEDLPNFQSVEEGKRYLKYHLRRSGLLKFLIVLDDIDHVEQLDCLCIMDLLNKFVNSLVIVTTRDQRVLVTAGITISYNLKGMDRNDARELFCWHAFGQGDPSSGYEDLVDAFLDVCRGLPLSLQVLGRHVHGADHKYWALELNKVRKTLPRDIQQRLRISIEALDRDEKQIFMDVACFFINKRKSMAMRVWEGSGWSAQHALETLKDKCIVVEEIRIDLDYEIRMGDIIWTHDLDLRMDDRLWKHDKVLSMHDHLRDIGREMANELSRPRRLWRPQGLRSLELKGFRDILAQTECRSLHSIFEGSMASHITFFLGESDDIVETSSLLWLEVDYLHKPQNPSIPSWIPLQNLQYLGINKGQLKRLWQSHAQAPSQLKELQLVETSLEEFPDSLGVSNNLEKVVLDKIECPKLEKLSLPCLTKLVELNISNLGRLRELFLPHLSCLERITIENCENLKRVSGISDITKPPHLSCLERITIENCKNLERLSGISDITKLVELNIRDLGRLRELLLPHLSCLERITIENCKNLKRVSGISDITKLVKLEISDCEELELELCLVGMNCLERIKVNRCGKVKCIEVSSCRNLKAVFGLALLTELEKLNIRDCPELGYLGDLGGLCRLEMVTIDGCGKLNRLYVDGCDSLKRVSGNLDIASLWINDCPELQEPLFVHGRQSGVEDISIDGCEKLQSITVPRRLHSLRLTTCAKLKSVVGICDLTKLYITECPELEELTSLTRVCPLEVIKIDNSEKLPGIAGVEELPALKQMKLSYCSNAAVQNCIHMLQSVPSEFMIAIGKAVDGAASILNPDLFPDEVIQILPSDHQSPVEGDDGTCSLIMAELGAIIVCAVVVVDSSTDTDLYHRTDQLEGFRMREGEWIITTVTTHQYLTNNYNIHPQVEDVFLAHGIMKKGCRMRMKKGEEWKILPTLQIIVHSLYEK